MNWRLHDKLTSRYLAHDGKQGRAKGRNTQAADRGAKMTLKSLKIWS